MIIACPISFKNRHDKGNVFALLFAAVAMIGVIGVVGMQTISGPIRTMTKVTQKNIAETDVITNGRIMILNAATLAKNTSDNPGPADPSWDGDYEIEPAPFNTTCSGTPLNDGGCLPTDVGAVLTDPWGTNYGYCVWDHGTTTTGTDMLAGSAASDGAAVAIISAGANRTFDTGCYDYDGSAPEGVDPAPGAGMVVTGTDDIAKVFTYQEAVAGAGGLWSLVGADGVLSASVTDDLAIGAAASIDVAGNTTGTAGTASFPVVRTDNLTSLTGTPAPITLAGGLQLDDNTGVPNTDCANAADAGILRWNTTGTSMEVCDGTSFVNVGTSSDRIIDANSDTYIDVDTAGDGSADTIRMMAYDGASSVPVIFADIKNRTIRFQTVDHLNDGIGNVTGGFEMLSSFWSGSNPDEAIQTLRIYSNAPRTTFAGAPTRPTILRLDSTERLLANFDNTKAVNSIMSRHTAQDNSKLDTAAIGLGLSATGNTSANLSGYIRFDTLLAGGTLSERMRITANGNVLIGTTTENGTALLQVDSTTKGFLPPRMTTAQRTAIASPADGLTVFDTNFDSLYSYDLDSATWRSFAQDTLIDADGDSGITLHQSKPAFLSSLSVNNEMQIAYVNNYPMTATYTSGGSAKNRFFSIIRKLDSTSDAQFRILNDVGGEMSAFGLTGSGTEVQSFNGNTLFFSMSATDAASAVHRGGMNTQGIFSIGNPPVFDASAILQATATGRGFLPPRVADAGTSISSPATGLMAFDSGSSDMEFYDGGGWRSMDAGAAASDERLKENLVPMKESIEKLVSLRTVEYEWKDKSRGKEKELGVIAQDVQKVFPLLVSTDGNGYLQVDYRRLTVPLIDAVKTLHAQNQMLKADVSETQSQLTALNDKILSLTQQIDTLNKTLLSDRKEARMDVSGLITLILLLSCISFPISIYAVKQFSKRRN